MNADIKTFSYRPSSAELLNIRRQAEAMRAAYLLSLFRRAVAIARAAITRAGAPAGTGLTAAR